MGYNIQWVQKVYLAQKVYSVRKAIFLKLNLNQPIQNKKRKKQILFNLYVKNAFRKLLLLFRHFFYNGNYSSY
jgi:hypothetical protein